MIESNLMIGDRVWYRPKPQTGNDFVNGHDLDERKIYTALVAGVVEYDPPIVNLVVFDHSGKPARFEKIKIVNASDLTVGSNACTTEITQRQLREANS